MGPMAPTDDEFAEFETTNAEFDAMAAAGEPVDVYSGPPAGRFYTVKVESSATYSGAKAREFDQVSTELVPQTAPETLAAA